MSQTLNLRISRLLSVLNHTNNLLQYITQLFPNFQDLTKLEIKTHLQFILTRLVFIINVAEWSYRSVNNHFLEKHPQSIITKLRKRLERKISKLDRYHHLDLWETLMTTKYELETVESATASAMQYIQCQASLPT